MKSLKMMKSVQILMRVIPHKKQRYDTCGDYWIDPLQRTIVNFRISSFKDKRYVFLIFLHELIEFFICRLKGITMKSIDKFDMEYEKTRPRPFARAAGLMHAPCGCKHKEEPGDDPHAPYFEAHQVATVCERLIAKSLGVDWKQYNDAVESL